MESVRNIIILNNLDSSSIEQAIIILKKNKCGDFQADEDIVCEAQKIIDDFIAKNNRRSRRSKEIKSILLLIPAAAILSLVMFLIFKFL